MEGRESVRAALVEAIAGLLVKERRYRDLVLHTQNLSSWFQSKRSFMDMFKGAEGNMVGMEALVRSQLLTESGVFYEALVGAGDLEDLDQPSVDDFEGLILAIDSTGKTYARLIKHAI